MTKYHENLLRDSTLSSHSMVKFISSLETKMILKIPNETFLRMTRYLLHVTSRYFMLLHVTSCYRDVLPVFPTSTIETKKKFGEGMMNRNLFHFLSDWWRAKSKRNIKTSPSHSLPCRVWEAVDVRSHNRRLHIQNVVDLLVAKVEAVGRFQSPADSSRPSFHVFFPLSVKYFVFNPLKTSYVSPIPNAFFLQSIGQRKGTCACMAE